MSHFFTRNSMGRVFGFLEVSSVRKNWKIYPNFKIPEIFGFLDLGLSLEPDTWLYLFGHGISQTQSMWGHTQNFSSFRPLILHLPGGGWISPPCYVFAYTRVYIHIHAPIFFDISSFWLRKWGEHFWSHKNSPFCQENVKLVNFTPLS